ncbi:MAG: metallophosphoesterase [Planctomycetes bacterium]|nr:metallophosphoesterase [Planctomycetota bacterium]
MSDAARVAEVFLEAARLNREDELRQGSLLALPNYGQVVMTGDLHGHRRNFDKLQQYCGLEHAGARHVILHELIHEDVASLTAADTSHEMLLAAAQWKWEFPDQVHFLQSNHELAQLNRHEITKNGRPVTLAFEDGVARAYGKGAGQVLDAIDEFIRSHPLAARSANRVFFSHSLPNSRDLPAFDPAELMRPPEAKDLVECGVGHLLVWGRYQNEAAIATLRELLDVDFFICGHQPQESGYDVLHDCMVILASDHNHGVFLPVDLNRPVTLAGLVKSIRPFAGVM